MILKTTQKIFHQHLLLQKFKQVKPPKKVTFIHDLDRMIKPSDFSEDSKHTIDLGFNFVAPDVNQGIIDLKNDIYSL